MTTLVEAKMGSGEDNTNDNMSMGTMGTNGLFVPSVLPTQQEERPGHLYSNTTSFTNAEAKGKVNFV